MHNSTVRNTTKSSRPRCNLIVKIKTSDIDEVLELMEFHIDWGGT